MCKHSAQICVFVQRMMLHCQRLSIEFFLLLLLLCLSQALMAAKFLVLKLMKSTLRYFNEEHCEMIKRGDNEALLMKVVDILWRVESVQADKGDSAHLRHDRCRRLLLNIFYDI